MTVDGLPILAYKVAEAQFDLCSDQSFISIRDQAVRVRTLMTAMKEGNLLDLEHVRRSKVLVVGAGYAGVSAALWLSDHNIKTWLIDRADKPFAMQRKCSTRYLSLTQYDWPALHRDVHDYPDGLLPDFIRYPWLSFHLVPPPRSPFGGGKARSHARWPPRRHDLLYTNGVKPAAQHVLDWDLQFKDAIKRRTLKWKPETVFSPGSINVADGRVDVALDDLRSGTPSPESFAYVFFATGFGSDAVKIAMRGGGWFDTKAFWADDDLAVPTKSPPKRILISGGGDGAVQDFVRALVNPTYQTAISVLNAVLDHMRGSVGVQRPLLEAGWAQVESMIEYAETQAGHAVAWSGDKRDCIWNDVQRQYNRALDQFCLTYHEQLIAAIAHVLDRPHPADEITLVYQTEHLQKVYPLNRLVFTLLREYFSYVGGGATDFFGAVPAPLRPLGCAPFPTVRVLPVHELDVPHSSYDPTPKVFYATVHHAKSGGGKSTSFDVDELLVRHGVPKSYPVVRAGLHTFGMEVGRVRLPFVSVA